MVRARDRGDGVLDSRSRARPTQRSTQASRREGGSLGLRAGASAAAELLVLAALAAGAEHAVGLTNADTPRHPAGALGERSRRVD
jgi:hypothetical protein